METRELSFIRKPPGTRFVSLIAPTAVVSVREGPRLMRAESNTQEGGKRSGRRDLGHTLTVHKAPTFILITNNSPALLPSNFPPVTFPRLQLLATDYQPKPFPYIPMRNPFPCPRSLQLYKKSILALPVLIPHSTYLRICTNKPSAMYSNFEE